MAYGLETYLDSGAVSLDGDAYLVRIVSEYDLAEDSAGSQTIAVPAGDVSFYITKPDTSDIPPHDVTLTRTSSSEATLSWGEPAGSDFNAWGPTRVTVFVYA